MPARASFTETRAMTAPEREPSVDAKVYPAPSTLQLLWAVLCQHCPRCFQGRIFGAPITMNENCPTCGLRFGREPGYFFGAMYLSYPIAVAWLLTPLVEVRSSWYQFQAGIFAIDVATLVGLVVLARLGRRRWPICAAAFQLFAVLTHIAFAINPHALYRAYLYANFSVGYLLLGAMVGGVLIEPRASSRSASEPRPRPAGAKRPA